MASKMVERKRADAAYLLAVAKVFVEKSAPEIARQLSPFLSEGESLPRLEILAALTLRRVDRRLERLVAADEANIAARAELSEARGERQRASSVVSDKLCRFRDIGHGLFGRESGGLLLGIDSQIPRQPLALRRSADQALERLRQPDLELPERCLSGVVLNTQELAADLEPATVHLRVALFDVEEKSAAAQLTQDAKDRAMAGFKAVYGPSIRLMTDLVGVVGKRGLVRMLRAKGRRKTVGVGSVGMAAAESSRGGA